jgi:hypothetical protein
MRMWRIRRIMGFSNDAEDHGFAKRRQALTSAQSGHPSCWSAASAVIRLLDSPVKPENDGREAFSWSWL